MTNIPSIEELRNIASTAGRKAETGMMLTDQVTAIRDAVVAACRPHLRPIAEMPAEVPEGCVRLFAGPSTNLPYGFTRSKCPSDTHYIDIALPSDTYPADFEAAFAKSGFAAEQKAAAFKLWKGGAR